MDSIGNFIRMSRPKKVDNSSTDDARSPLRRTEAHAEDLGKGGSGREGGGEQFDLAERPKRKQAYSNEAFTEMTDSCTSGREKERKSLGRKKGKQEKGKPGAFQMGHGPKPAWHENGKVESGSDEDAFGDRNNLYGSDEIDEKIADESFRYDCLNTPISSDELDATMMDLERNAKVVSESIEARKAMVSMAHKRASTAHRYVEIRKQNLIKAIEEHSRRLHENVEEQTSAFDMESTKAIDRLDETLTAIRDVLKMKSSLGDQHCQAIRDRLSTWLYNCQDAMMAPKLLNSFIPSTTESVDEAMVEQIFSSLLSSESDFEGPDDDSKYDTDNVVKLAHGSIANLTDAHRSTRGQFGVRLTGRIEHTIKPTGMYRDLRDLRKNAEAVDDTVHDVSRSVAFRVQHKILGTPQLIRTFSSRLEKDKRPCGVTDLALTDSGEVLVLDKKNKTIKMFDSNGVLVMRQFAKTNLRKPSRISRLQLGNQFAVTDEQSNRVLVFSPDGGQVLSQLTMIQRPVSHCQLDTGHVAVIDFSNKSVVICDLISGKVVSSFPTRMECPAYMACTKSGLIIVTDWKSGSMKSFNLLGEQIFSYSHETSYSTRPESASPSESAPNGREQLPSHHHLPHTEQRSHQVEEPYGVCADEDGVVMVADRKRREIMFYTGEGREIWSYNDVKDKIGLPFAVTCNGRGTLAIGEYTGTIRLIQYKIPSN